MLRPLISRRNGKDEYTGGSSGYQLPTSNSRMGASSTGGNATYSSNRYFERLDDDGVHLSEIVVKSDGDRGQTAYSASSRESTSALNAKTSITVTRDFEIAHHSQR
jgi:hypothetical protein